MAALVRPGGAVALTEADWQGQFCDPPLPAWDRLIELVEAYAGLNDIDQFIGRRVPRLLREAGLLDVRVDPVIHTYPHGHRSRWLLVDFAQNLRERLVDAKLVAEAELDDLVATVHRHIDDPHTLVVSHLLFRAWGRRPH
jgi:hypothetical protein